MLSETPHSRLPAAGPRLAREVLASAFLGRDVELTFLLPPAGVGAGAPATYPVLYLNDGQDLDRLNLPATLAALYARQAVRPFLVVAIHANERRVQEYGTAAQPDFNGRGRLAGAYTAFVLRELLPFAQARYQAAADPAAAVLAGFSLGGLSAFDVVWHHPEAFGRAGVFSGSFWWRRRAVGAGYTPADRIMHGLVRASRPQPSPRFWLQTGTLDERHDRTGTGVIDSIADCLDLIDELIARGLNADEAIRYVQVEGGHHHPDTWGRVMPDFLVWAFGRPEAAARQRAPLPVVRLQLDPALVPALLPPTAVVPAPARPGPPLVLPAPSPTGPLAPAATTFASVSGIHLPPSSFVPMTITRPVAGEFLPYHAAYINFIPLEADPREVLRTQAPVLHAVFANLSEAQAETTYAPGKWTLKDVLLHLIDTERIFAYRALRFARGDQQNLPGFEQDDYAAQAGAATRTVPSLLAEYDAVRAASLALVDSFTEEQLVRGGTANGGPITVRALLYLLPGHERHHLHIIRERYQPLLQG